MKKYKYKYIKPVKTYGGWCAEYREGYRVLTLHVGCLPTRFMAYNEAKKEVDYLNEYWEKKEG